MRELIRKDQDRQHLRACYWLALNQAQLRLRMVTISNLYAPRFLRLKDEGQARHFFGLLPIKT